VKCSPAAADTCTVVIPARILTLAMTAATIACAGMTLLLLAAR
jgi:hypothetical protein